MIAILNYLQFVFYKIVGILNIKPFDDFPVSILQLLLTGIILRYVFKFISGGFNEFEMSSDWFNSQVRSRSISNVRRKVQKIDEYRGSKKNFDFAMKHKLYKEAGIIEEQHFKAYGEHLL